MKLLHVDPINRVAHLSPRRPKGMTGDAFEKRVWAFGDAARGKGGPVILVENGLNRGPDWPVRCPDGVQRVVAKDAWVVGLAFDAPTWARCTTRDALTTAAQDFITSLEPRTERKPTMKKEKRLAKEQPSGWAGNGSTSASVTASTALSYMRDLEGIADQAGRAGDATKEAGVRRELALWKLRIGEEQHLARGGMGHHGPGVRELFKRVGRLPEDTALGGL